MYTLDDTIVAISTPLGTSGIGIVRLSGAEALAIAKRLFVPTGRAGRRELAPNRLYHGHIVAPGSGQVVDEVLLSYMRAPHSYTRQDVVEINAHGGPVPLRAILALCLAEGARPAREGEFTLRAFLNGRLDLAQAEAVLDVIRAQTEASLRVAVEQLSGRLSAQVRSMRGELLNILAHLQAAADFPEDEIPALELGLALRQAEARLDQLLGEAERGIIYRQGLHVAILGRPNVGKSSLLNALLRTERAIVTPIPGTTRDTLEETLNLQGIPVVVVDTAGIAESDDLVERLGIERSRAAAQRADLVLVVVDGSQPPAPEDAQVAALANGRPAIVVVNKGDLPQVDGYADLLPTAPHVRLSALTGEGLPALEECILELILSGRATASGAPMVSNPRHRDLLRRARDHVAQALAALDEGWPHDLLAIDVTEAVEALGEITGETASEELLETIFGQFCIGK